jgi:hypothetical protein
MRVVGYIFLIYLLGCAGPHIPRKYAKYATVRYNPEHIMRKGLGFKKGAYTLVKNVGTSQELKIYYLFYTDGTFAEHTDLGAMISYNSINGRCGAYTILGDTIIAQSYNYKFALTSYEGREHWFLMLDSSTLQLIDVKLLGDQLIDPFVPARYTPAKYLTTDTLPDCNCWVKKYKWMWDREEDWLKSQESRANSK